MHEKQTLYERFSPKRALVTALLLAIVGGLAFSLYPAHARVGMKFNEFMTADSLRPTIAVNGVATKIRKFTPSVRLIAEKFLTKEHPLRGSAQEPTSCTFDLPLVPDKDGVLERATPSYEAQILSAEVEENVLSGEIFPMLIRVKNTGTVPWFSLRSGCAGSYFRLGTAHEKDHDNPFYVQFDTLSSGWVSPQRLHMREARVDPGEVANFVFWNRAPEKKGIYVEYFKPVLEGDSWIEIPEFKMRVNVGELTEEDFAMEKFLLSGSSSSTAAIDPKAEIRVDINLSDRHMRVYKGDVQIRDFPVSPGKAKTPTPVGTFRVLNKQTLRVGGDWPHYRMPFWQGFTKWGHGLHALPYLANDGGSFWKEANSHLGLAVSHGCVRVGDSDAEDLYGLTKIGDKIVIHY